MALHVGDIHDTHINGDFIRLEELARDKPNLAENMTEIIRGKYGAPTIWAFVAGQFDGAFFSQKTSRFGKHEDRVNSTSLSLTINIE